LYFTRAIKEDVKGELLKYASELQIRLGRRVDYNEAIHHLLMQRKRHPALLREACETMPGAEKARRTLVEERRRDEDRAEGRPRP
jgi:hypothetical protein